MDKNTRDKLIETLAAHLDNLSAAELYDLVDITNEEQEVLLSGYEQRILARMDEELEYFREKVIKETSALPSNEHNTTLIDKADKQEVASLRYQIAKDNQEIKRLVQKNSEELATLRHQVVKDNQEIKKLYQQIEESKQELITTKKELAKKEEKIVKSHKRSRSIFLQYNRPISDTFIGSLLGFRFCPDGHLIPIFRKGLFNRIQSSGEFWLRPQETAGNLIFIGNRVANLTFDQVTTRDGIDFKVSLVVKYKFDPRQADTAIRPSIIKITNNTINEIVSYPTEQIVRHLILQYDAHTIYETQTRSDMTLTIQRYIDSELRRLGIAILNRGVLLTKINPPESFKQNMMQVQEQRALIHLFSSVGDPTINEQAIRAKFLHNLETSDGVMNVLNRLQEVLNPNDVPSNEIDESLNLSNSRARTNRGV